MSSGSNRVAYAAGRAVLEFARPTSRQPDLDDRFIKSVGTAFPMVASRQQLAPETPLNVPYLVVQSTASRLAVSATGAEFGVRFFGDFATDFEHCRHYLRDKLSAVIQAWRSLGVSPALLGIVITSNFPRGSYKEAVAHLEKTHIKVDSSMPLSDAALRVALEIDEKYYASITLSTYRQAELTRPFFPGQQLLVKPWEATVKEAGISAEVDVNNRLESLLRKRDSVVTVDELDRMVTIMDRMEAALPAYLQTGRLRLGVAEETSNVHVD